MVFSEEPKKMKLFFNRHLVTPGDACLCLHPKYIRISCELRVLMGTYSILIRSWITRNHHRLHCPSRVANFSTGSESSDKYDSTSSSSSSSSSSSDGNASSAYFHRRSSHYEVLGLDDSCSQKDVRTAFIERSKQYHPDSSQRNDLSPGELKSKFQQVNEAYQVLNNPESRQNYDISLKYGQSIGNAFGSRGYTYGSPYSTPQYAPPRRDKYGFYRQPFPNYYEGKQRDNYDPRFTGRFVGYQLKVAIFIMFLAILIETCNICLGMVALGSRRYGGWDSLPMSEKEYLLMMKNYRDRFYPDHFQPEDDLDQNHENLDLNRKRM